MTDDNYLRNSFVREALQKAELGNVTEKVWSSIRERSIFTFEEGGVEYKIGNNLEINCNAVLSKKFSKECLEERVSLEDSQNYDIKINENAKKNAENRGMQRTYRTELAEWKQQFPSEDDKESDDGRLAKPRKPKLHETFSDETIPEIFGLLIDSYEDTNDDTVRLERKLRIVYTNKDGFVNLCLYDGAYYDDLYSSQQEKEDRVIYTDINPKLYEEMIVDLMGHYEVELFNPSADDPNEDNRRKYKSDFYKANFTFGVELDLTPELTQEQIIFAVRSVYNATGAFKNGMAGLKRKYEQEQAEKRKDFLDAFGVTIEPKV
ncbi:hypothetical protein HN385_00805 [archaeon]|jgi:hypothetical protein|nr:hypothetical protein [archaeon]MBT3451275.1 hypothetical protein [archaeon]MBT6869558.1 hypothetical protein [archaeon]MBT7193450.1 hypothetical protein [archaeon]MBT7381041.1 hypothetical protein [archaeon]